MRAFTRISKALVGSTCAALCAVAVPTSSSEAAAADGTRAVSAPVADGRRPPNLDGREMGASQAARASARLVVRRIAAEPRFAVRLGDQGVFDYDPLTGTVRLLARLDGYLSRRSHGSARHIARRFVRHHLPVLGLTDADLATLAFDHEYVDNLGVHNLFWTQAVDGTPLYGNGLIVRVADDGRVLQVAGSPVTDLAARAAAAPAFSITASAARSDAAEDVAADPLDDRVAASTRGAAATTTWTNGDRAAKVWFLTADGLRPAWSTYLHAHSGGWRHVVDAASGRTLLRASTSRDYATPASPGGLGARRPVDDGTALVYRNSPGRPRGGRPVRVDLIDRGWLGHRARYLSGHAVSTWADTDASETLDPGERTVVPGRDGTAGLRLHAFDSAPICGARFPCTYDELDPYSWQVNRDAVASNAFYLANVYHDYLRRNPSIAFTRGAGSFERAGGDRLHQLVLYGADADGSGVPGPTNNAWMDTPPDGQSPTMALYQWTYAAFDVPVGYPHFTPTSAGLDASMVFHEYTHGLTSRLAVDAAGNEQLDQVQAAALAEGWSDYYALDYLASRRLVRDTDVDGEVVLAPYLVNVMTNTAGDEVRTLRNLPIDCPVDSSSTACVNWIDKALPDGQPGGYTYGHMVDVWKRWEPHSASEVWSETLWDLRTALGPRLADELITRGVSYAPAQPSYLEARNAVLQADVAGHRGHHLARLWHLFAKRGMGFYAGSAGTSDVQPGEDFHVAPRAATGVGTVSGVVSDNLTGEPLAGAAVTITVPGDQYSAVTDETGHYTIGEVVGVPAGTYAKVRTEAPGYLPVDATVAVVADGDAPLSVQVDRDWAAATSGGEVVAFDGPDWSPDCGPADVIDMSALDGWLTNTGDEDDTPSAVFTPKSVEIELAQPIDVASVEINPDAGCGLDWDSALGDYRVEVSTDGTSWTTFDEGHFGFDDRGHLNRLEPQEPATDIRYVRLTMLGDQMSDALAAFGRGSWTYEQACDPDGPLGGQFLGCAYAGVGEIAVTGTPHQ